MSDFEIIRNMDLQDDDSIIDIINKCHSDIYEGLNENDEMTVISIEQNSGIRITTFQHNGWTRINDYDIFYDEYGNIELVRSELYET